METSRGLSAGLTQRTQRPVARWRNGFSTPATTALNESGFAAKELAPAVPAIVGALRSKNDHYDAVGLIERLGPIAKRRRAQARFIFEAVRRSRFSG